MRKGSSVQKKILKWSKEGKDEKDDFIAVEEPLEIRITQHTTRGIVKKRIAVTMRTPGHDLELSIGFLFAEGIIQDKEVLNELNSNHNISTKNSENILELHLASDVVFEEKALDRNFYVTSSCGVCGKASLEAVQEVVPAGLPTQPFYFPAAGLLELPEKLKQTQETFDLTGGLHAAALFSSTGELKAVYEDVGRHNALDKLIGGQILRGNIPLSEKILLLSGRISFELVQKAIMANIPIIVAIGAPSSLAIELAEDHDVTLVGFMKSSTFNVYTGKHRLI